MRKKIFTFIAALILVLTTSVAPIKVVAQGLMEYALILVLVPLGAKETGEVYLVQKPQPTQTQGNSKVAFIYKVQRVSPSDPSGNGICQETVEAPLETLAGLNILNIQMGEENKSLIINGEDVDLTEPCLEDAERVAVAIGRKVPPAIAQRMAADPTAAQGLALHEVWGWTSVGENGETAAISHWDEGFIFLDISNP